MIEKHSGAENKWQWETKIVHVYTHTHPAPCCDKRLEIHTNLLIFINCINFELWFFMLFAISENFRVKQKHVERGNECVVGLPFICSQYWLFGVLMLLYFVFVRMHGTMFSVTLFFIQYYSHIYSIKWCWYTHLFWWFLVIDGDSHSNCQSCITHHVQIINV